MNKHNRKIIAPLVIVIAVIAYYFALAAILIRLNIPAVIKIIALIFSIAVTVVFIAVLIERIKEIKKGEEDDLGNY